MSEYVYIVFLFFRGQKIHDVKGRKAWLGLLTWELLVAYLGANAIGLPRLAIKGKWQKRVKEGKRG